MSNLPVLHAAHVRVVNAECGGQLALRLARRQSRYAKLAPGVPEEPVGESCRVPDGRGSVCHGRRMRRRHLTAAYGVVTPKPFAPERTQLRSRSSIPAHLCSPAHQSGSIVVLSLRCVRPTANPRRRLPDTCAPAQIPGAAPQIRAPHRTRPPPEQREGPSPAQRGGAGGIGEARSTLGEAQSTVGVRSPRRRMAISSR